MGKARGSWPDCHGPPFYMGEWEVSEETEKIWKGGPIYCLGGRSAVWSLFSTRYGGSSAHFLYNSNALALWIGLVKMPSDLTSLWKCMTI